MSIIPYLGSVGKPTVPTAAGGGGESWPWFINGHISARCCHNDVVDTVTFHPGGAVFKAWQLPGQAQEGGGRRQAIDGLSADVRSRLRRRMSEIDWPGLCETGRTWGITLTYPGQPSARWPDVWPRDHVQWQAHLRAFRERMARRGWLEWCLWRKEFQRRGAPHFHLVGLSPTPILDGAGKDWERDPIGWVARSWFEIVGSGQMDHLNAGTQLVSLYVGHLDNYLTGEISKAYQAGVGTPGGTGRVWGEWGKLPPALEWSTKFKIGERDHVLFMRRLRQWAHSRRWRDRPQYAEKLTVHWQGWLAQDAPLELIRGLDLEPLAVVGAEL
jgi:hypothetical protein